jgi:putative ABC transport system substrate-binding protein
MDTGRRLLEAFRSRLGRRLFISTLVALAAAPLLAQTLPPKGGVVVADGPPAQSKGPKKVVWLYYGNEKARERIRTGFRSSGILEGRDITLTFQSLPDRDEDADALAASLVRSRPDVIVLVAHATVWSLKKRTRDIPIVFYNLSFNPATVGLVESLARPGGNLTGSSQVVDEFAQKDLQLFKQLVPSLKRLGLILDKKEAEWAERVEPELVASHRARLRRLEARHGMEVVELLVPEGAGRDAIARIVSASGVQAVWLESSSSAAGEFAFSAPIPAKCFGFARVRKGCVFGWSFEWLEGETYAIQAVQRILRGESPAVIPVYQTPIAIALNRRRARELRIEIPASLLIQAREVYD